MTISTSGVVPAIDRLKDFTDASLAISLHAPNDELRSEIVPINRKYPISELLRSVTGYMSSLSDFAEREGDKAAAIDRFVSAWHDLPDNVRKMHNTPVAYLGGVAVFLGWLGGLAVLLGVAWANLAHGIPLAADGSAGDHESSCPALWTRRITCRPQSCDDVPWYRRLLKGTRTSIS